MSDLHDRVAKVLGWSTKDVQSMSMQSLRDLVRPVDADLARQMDYVIQSGAYVRGAPAPRMSSLDPTRLPGTKIWERVDWKAPGSTEPIKYSWKIWRSSVRADEADKWLEIYRRDHPGSVFVASPTKPRAKKGPKIIRGPGSDY